MNGVDQSTATLSAFTVATGVNGTSPSGVLSRGAGAALPGSTGSNNFGASGFTATTLADAISNDDFFSFSITAAAGYELSLSSIEWNMQITTSGPTSGALFSSATGFTEGNDISSYAITTAEGGGDQTISLTDITALQSITGTVEFRIYGWGGGAGTTDKFRFRNLGSGDLLIAGTVSAAPLPEPAAASLLAGVAVLTGAIATRRRRGAVARA